MIMDCRLGLLNRAFVLAAIALAVPVGARAQLDTQAPVVAAVQAPAPTPMPIAEAAAPIREPAPARVAAPPVPPVEPLKARYQLRVMEGVLENAVQHGIQSVGTQMRLVTPDLIFFGSPARARGFRLEGYGTFFDVDVPTLRPSVAWSMRTLSQITPDMSRAIQSLRRVVESQGDAHARQESEQALRLIELQVRPIGQDGGATSGGDTAAHVEPARAYETEVKRALVDAILDYGGTISLGPDEWLIVAARANDAMGQDSLENVTVQLKMRAGDLHALRVGTLTREEAKQRVNITEF
jgi:hypothetical protein